MQKSLKNPPIAFPFDPAINYLGNSEVSNYLLKYLKAIKTETCVFEDHYVDKDYLIDYSKFYARSFEPIERRTKRFHFFSFSFSKTEFTTALKKNDTEFFKKLEDNYCGFIVVKPIKDRYDHFLIGRTLLKTYPSSIGNETRKYLMETYKISLYGIPLTIESLPFQVQDIAVGACATIACWISLFPLVSLFGVPMLSPIEVTEKSVSFPSDCRNFPSEGLSIYQMKNYFNSIGLETEFVKPQEFQSLQESGDNFDIVADVVRAYNKMGLPIIAGLELKDHDSDPDYHAVVISGYRHKNSDINEIYVHDDNIGPYSVVKPAERGMFYTWKNEWLDSGFSEVKVTRLLIPVYPKIRLSFGLMYDIFLEKYKKPLQIQIQSSNVSENSRAELFLTDIRNYKKFLLTQRFKNKKDILYKPMPRFLWVVRLQCDGTPHYDFVFDGTAVHPKLICQPIFEHN